MPLNNVKFARILRKNLAGAEQKLWYYLRKRQLGGFRFQRQVPIGNYIVDFLCYEKKLIIELDGGQHDEPEKRVKDQQRSKWLQDQGYLIKRYWNNEVQEQYKEVLENILQICLARKI